MLTRRSLFGLIPAAALPAVSVSPTAGMRPIGLIPAVPALAPRDQLARLAVHYARQLDRLAALSAEVDRLFESGGVDAAYALEDEPFDRAAAAFDRAERALRDAMRDRDARAFTAGGRLFVDTCAGPTIPDRPRWLWVHDLVEGPSPGGPLDGPDPSWLFTPDRLVGSTNDEGPGPIYLEFELVGAEADLARAWLRANTVSIAEALAADEEGVAR